MAPTPCLPGLFGPPPRQHKAVRQTSREVYRRRRDRDRARAADGKETRAGAALRLLAYHFNVTQTSATASELQDWLERRGASPFRHVGDLRPRLRELFEQGLIEPRGKRRCRITGQVVHTWAVREAGSKEPR